ncbi:diguanylate cyclase [Pseudalkalibacillus caeni]|uniref:Diguanylate cyclase n=1 Tax=Exobacillus caeni TaxID=2574798 RepID=A0A5R9FFW8_9BACL|nr:diguanylate cyclase [Pseudalkalibacillus caeni]TLS38455.1 diguanylate cyclase [Pseudalkalibacillus caeni]
MQSNLVNKPINLYLGLISLTGILLFISFYKAVVFSPGDWLIVISLIIATSLLIHFTILLPPSGNSLSMDSSIYLASLFILGLTTTLTVHLIASLIHGLYQRKIVWWKHVFNFSIYTIMILGTYFTYQLTGGKVGTIEVMNLHLYFISMGAYFLLNVLLIGIFFLISASDSLYEIFKGIFKETMSSYLITLVLSIILAILMLRQPILGIVLFTAVALLLSLAFKQYFELYQEVSEKANLDHLTGLNNHGYFKELLEKEIQAARTTGSPLSIGILDLDDFKKYNDFYGHLQGDELLKRFGTQLKESVKKDYITARYGGEEFIVLFPGTNEQEAFKFFNHLRKQVNDTHYNGVEIFPHGCLSFSAGVIEFDREIYDSADLLEKADKAMYYAKNKGKNNVCLFDENVTHEDLLNIDHEMELIEQQLRIFLYKDVYTYRHSRRVYEYAIEFSNKLLLSEAEKKTLIMGALIHDIGKLEIPRDILNKKGKLDDHEWEMVQKHVTFGKDIVSTNRELHDLLPLVELHHERFDGKGYPYGLKGNAIPKLVRILTVIDSFDAMTTERPYQKTKTFKEALEELKACAGTQFDPILVELFTEMVGSDPTKNVDNVLITAN